MSRPLRVEYEHAFYHVISRGHRCENIFQNDADRKKFLKKLSWVFQKLQLKIHGYVLMSNHYHLLVETPQANITKAMHDINAGYANWYRAKYKLIGSIFQGRYKAIIVDKDEYLLVLSAYIHLNPVRAGIVSAPEDYEWSSYKSYIGMIRSPTFLFVSEILAKFRDQSEYMKYVDSFLEDKKCIKRWDIYGRNSFLGSDDFIRKALSSIENGRENCGEVSGERELHQVGWDEVMQVVLTICQVGEDDILSRNKENVYRKIFIYLLRKYTGLKLHEIGGKLGMKYRAVSEMERNFLKELVDSKLLQKKVAMVERDLKKMTLWGR